MEECIDSAKALMPSGGLCHPTTITQRLQTERGDLQRRLNEIDDVLKKLGENQNLAEVLNSLSRINMRL